MPTYIVIRFAIAGYFLFTAFNKLFFFDVFVRRLSLTPLPLLPDWWPVWGALLIAAELLFAGVVVFSGSRLLLRSAALLMCLPFLVYDFYIVAFLGADSCNCSFGFGGKSLTSPLFSVAVLLLTILGAWAVSTQGALERHPRRPVALALVFVALLAGFFGLGAYMRGVYETADLHAPDYIPLLSAAVASEPQIDVYTRLGADETIHLVHSLCRLGEKIDRRFDIHALVGEPAELMIGLGGFRGGCGVSFATVEEGTLEALSHVGVRIYEGDRLLYRVDDIDFVTAFEFEYLVESLARRFESLSGCVPDSQALLGVRRLIEAYDVRVESEPQASERTTAYFLMSAGALAGEWNVLNEVSGFLGGWDDVRFQPVIVGESAENRIAGAVCIPLRELAEQEPACCHLNVAVLLCFPGDVSALVPVHPLPGRFEAKIRSAMERFGRPGRVETTVRCFAPGFAQWEGGHAGPPLRGPTERLDWRRRGIDALPLS